MRIASAHSDPCLVSHFQSYQRYFGKFWTSKSHLLFANSQPLDLSDSHHDGATQRHSLHELLLSFWKERQNMDYLLSPSQFWATTCPKLFSNLFISESCFFFFHSWLGIGVGFVNRNEYFSNLSQNIYVLNFFIIDFLPVKYLFFFFFKFY